MAWIEDKRVVVTGATSGIGKAVAVELASLGAHVVLACRDGVRGKQLASEINARIGAHRAAAMTVDTSDPKSIRAFSRDTRHDAIARRAEGWGTVSSGERGLDLCQ